MDYIFGYGSIINDASRIATCTSRPNMTTSANEVGGGMHDLAVAARVCSSFARRVWNFRCPTGFTALGIILQNEGQEHNSPGINGVLFPTRSHHDLTAFDIREVGYSRVSVPLDKIRLLPEAGCLVARARAITLQSEISEASLHTKETKDKKIPRVWIYVPDASHTASPSVEYPILQTYVDVCIEGCLLWGGREFAIEFLKGTSNWSEYYLNDTPMSRRPWLHRKDYKRVDECLRALSDTVRFDCRKHPDEFASLHLTSLKGMFGVPPRNRAFVGRESFLQAVHSKLSDLPLSTTHASEVSDTHTLSEGFHDRDVGVPAAVTVDSCDSYRGAFRNKNSQVLKQVEISGIGGVGKSQIAIEYAHRCYSSNCYALVAWFRAESAASIASDMRKLAFELGIIKVGRRRSNSVGGVSGNIIKKNVVSEGLDKDSTEAEVEHILRRGVDDSKMYSPTQEVADSDMGKDLEEYDDVYIINELMRRLGLCRFKWLFIFDNIEDPSIIPTYLPRGMGGDGCGHVVVTSRIQDFEWIMKGSSLTLDCFDTVDSVNYLKSTLGLLFLQRSDLSADSNDKEDVLYQLSIRMGNLPLALSIAVAYMVRCDVTPADYLKHVNMPDGGGVKGNMDAISTSLNVTLKRIREECQSASTVLPCLGYFAPDNISKEIVQLCLLSDHYCQVGPQPRHEQFISYDVEPTVASNLSIQKFGDKNNFCGDIVDVKWAVYLVIVVSTMWAIFLLQEFSTRDFGTGVVSGCLLLMDVVVLTLWLHPCYELYVKTNPSDNCEDDTAVPQRNPGTKATNSVLAPPFLSTDLRFEQCVDMIDNRPACVVSSEVTAEADRIWDIMKQFSLLSIRGRKGNGSIHRLQQAVLRASYDSSLRNGTLVFGGGLIEKVSCIERCIWVLSKRWKFDKNDSLSWQEAGGTIEHIQVIGKHVIDMMPEEAMSASEQDVDRLPTIREEFFLLLSVLLNEGGVYISMVLSRFDSAQQLLEWSHLIQSHLLRVVALSCDEASHSQHADSFSVNFLSKLNDCLASSLFILGKIFRYNDKLLESEIVLKESLTLRKRIPRVTASPTANINTELNNSNGAIADILHELGVLCLRKHDLYNAKSYLTRSLNMKYKHAKELQETDESSTLHQLGVVATLERRYDDAEALLMQALDFQDDNTQYSPVTEHSLKTRTRQRTKTSCSNMTTKAATLQQLGRVELRRGKLDQADSFLTKALDLYLAAYGEVRASSHVNVAGVRHQLGAAAMAAKDFDRACEHFATALATRELICSQSSGGKDQVISELLALGQGEVERGQYNVAETLFLRAKSSIEFDLCCASSDPKTACLSKSFSTIEKETGNFSSAMLLKCGYGNDTGTELDNSASGDRKRGALIKQLLFCVHLLRGVARLRSDVDASALYSSELKHLSQKYPSSCSRRAKRHKNVPVQAVKLSTDIHQNQSVEYDNSLNIFENDSHGPASEVPVSSCRSGLYITDDALPATSNTIEMVARLVAVRCCVRRQCKIIQRQEQAEDYTDLTDDVLHCQLNILCDTFCDETFCRLVNGNERINMTIQKFISSVACNTSLASCSVKIFLRMLFTLSDDLRNDITLCGFRLEDL